MPDTRQTEGPQPPADASWVVDLDDVAAVNRKLDEAEASSETVSLATVVKRIEARLESPTVKAG